MKQRKNNIFSAKNLLIGFFGVVFLLLIFNYFYSIFSSNNSFFNEDSNLGELYTTVTPPNPPDGGPKPPSSSGSSDGKNCQNYAECGECEDCVNGKCRGGGSGMICGSNLGSGMGICDNGVCPKCNVKCGDCQVCDKSSNEHKCVPSDKLDTYLCEDRTSTCKGGKCLVCNKPKCDNQCQTCVDDGEAGKCDNRIVNCWNSQGDHAACSNGKCPECKPVCGECMKCVDDGTKLKCIIDDGKKGLSCGFFGVAICKNGECRFF